MNTVDSPRFGGRIARIGCIAALAVASFGVAACGSDDDGSTTTAADAPATTADARTGTGGDASNLVAQACDTEKQAMAPVSWNGPTQAFDASVAKGKTVWWIKFGTNGAGTEMTNGAKEAAKEIGLNFKEFDGKFTPSEWNRGMEQAVAQKADVIVAFATDTKLISEGMAKAEAAGIPVIYVVSPEPTKTWGDEDAVVTFDFRDAGRILASSAVCRNDGNVIAHIVQDTTYPNSGPTIEGAKSVLDECEECQVEISNMPLGDWPKRVPTDVKTALTKNPDINFVFPLYDFGAPPAATAIGEAGKTDDIVVGSINGDPVNLALVCSGGQTGTAAQPTNWIGWAAVDQMGRLLAGEEPVDQKIPTRLLTKDNLDCPAPKNQKDEMFGTVDYRGEYRKLWTGAAR